VAGEVWRIVIPYKGGRESSPSQQIQSVRSCDPTVEKGSWGTGKWERMGRGKGKDTGPSSPLIGLQLHCLHSPPSLFPTPCRELPLSLTSKVHT